MIKSLRLRNFKCFSRQKIDFSNVTLLSGLNGMGKSSVLQTLLLLRQSYQQGLLPKTGIALNGDLVRIGAAQDALYDDAQEDLIGFHLVWDDATEAEWLFNYDREADVLSLASGPDTPDVYSTSVFRDDFHYLQAERIGPRTTFEVSDYLVRHHRQLGVRGEYAAYYLATFGRDPIPNDSTAHPKAPSLKLEDQVAAWMGEVSPGVRLDVSQYSGIDLVAVHFSYATRTGSTNQYRATNVGFGLTYTLPVLLALLSAPRGSLVLIENPEAHLHPQGQVKMGELIARAAAGGVQVIVETHSDHVLNGMRIAVHSGLIEPDKVALHFFTRESETDKPTAKVISPTLDRNGRINKWPKGFFDEFDKSLEALLLPSGGE